MSTGVIYPAQPEKILKALGQVWTSLGKEEKQQGKPTVLRACAMTLIVATDDEDKDGFSASQTLIELMHEHPSRGIVLRVTEQSEKGLEARVLAQCWKPFGKAQQICCEQIEILASPENWPKVGPTVTGIIAADLPVVLWCRQNSALNPSASANQKAGMETVLGFAGKVIVDTEDSDVEPALSVLASWRAQGRVVADLEWTRLTPWREALAHAFDSPEKKHDQYDRAEIYYAGAEPKASVLYMGGWLAYALNASVSFVKSERGFGSGLQQVILRADQDVVELSRTSDSCMTLRSGGRDQKYSYTDLALYPLMNEELRVLGQDPIFNGAFERTREFPKR